MDGRVDWYERRDELEPGMVFTDRDGDLLKLDHRKPGDGTKWVIARWWGDSWAYMEDTVEPGDLVEQRPDPETLK